MYSQQNFVHSVTPLQMIHGLMAAFVLLSSAVQYK